MSKKIKNMLFLVGIVCILGKSNAYANKLNLVRTLPSTKSQIDSSYLTLNEDTFIENGRLFVPLRELAEKIGCTVTWNSSTNQIKVTRGFKSVLFALNKNKIFVDNIEKTIDVAPKLINNKTYLPIRYLVESLGDKVEWVPPFNSNYFVEILEQDKCYVNGNWCNIVDLSKTYQEKLDNGAIVNIKVSVPQILNTNDSVAIDKINEYYRKLGRDQFDKFKKLSLDCNDLDPEVIKHFKAENVDFQLSYAIGYNANNILSVIRLSYVSAMWATHPSYELYCDTFDINTGKKLRIDEILNGSTDEIKDFLINRFSKMIDESKYYDFTVKEGVKNNISEVQFYLSNNNLVFFFNRYIVTSYSGGMPGISIDLQENSLLFKRKFTNITNVEEESNVLNTAKNIYTNPVIIDKSILNGQDCYILQCDNNLIAIDRNCENLYTIVNNKNSYHILNTKRINKINNLSALRLVMNKMNSEDLSYDIGGVLHNDDGEYIIVAMQSLEEDVTSKLAVNKDTGEIFSYYFEEQK